MLFPVAFLLLTAWVFFWGALRGFCPMDEGLVLAQTHRVLLGQTPHVDFVAPRPALSAVLHLVDYLLPMPLFRASRLLGLLEIATYTTVSAALVFRRAPSRWSLVQILGWATALLLNVHGFPLMAWYTIDGILLVAAGFALVRRGATESGAGPTLTYGFLLLGAAPLTKQSFFAAPLIGAVQLLACRRKFPPALRARAVLHGMVVAATPGIVYGTVVVARGGFAPLQAQLLGAHPTWGQALLLPLANPSFRRRLLTLAGALLATSACDVIGRRTDSVGAIGRLLSLAVRGATSVALLAPALGSGLTWAYSAWGAETLWMAAGVFAWRATTTRAVDGVAVTLLLLGWMTSLSWGYASPKLVAGSLVLAAAWALWRDAPTSGQDARARPLRVAAALLALVAFLATARVFAVARSRPYFDRPSSEAIVDLGGVASALAGIRANVTTAAFLRDLTACIAHYPARWVAVVPDNAWIYPALGLENPLPLDWLYPPEYGFDGSAILRRVRWLAQQGDYLVLFQPFPAHLICPRDEPLPAAALSFFPQGYGDGMPTRIWQALGGRRVACGSVLGKWKPRHAHRLRGATAAP